MADPLVFYTNPQSRGRIARWMLEEVGTTYETEILDYGTTMKAPGYLAINRMGKVPAIRHGDTVITECAAICAYLADAFPAAGLAPPLDQRGDYYRWLFFAAGPLEQSVVNTALGFEVPEDRQVMAGYGCISDVMETLDGALDGKRYITGDTFTAADVYIGSQVAWGLQFKTIEERENFKEYAARVTDRDAYRRAAELDDATAV